jgi:hypothetical protein
MHEVVSYSNAYLLIQNISEIIYQPGKLKFQVFYPMIIDFNQELELL